MALCLGCVRAGNCVFVVCVYLCIFLVIPRVGLQSVIMIFPRHPHLHFDTDILPKSMNYNGLQRFAR